MTKDMTQGIGGSSVCRFADIEILRYRIDGFEELPLERKLLVYHLSEAALSGRDIIFDQHSRYGLRLRHLLEGIYRHYGGDRTEAQWCALEEYLFRLWFSSGIHHHYGNEKFEPRFDQAFLLECLDRVQQEACTLLEYTSSVMQELCAEIFDPERSPRRTVQDGRGDHVQASSINFYDPALGQSEADAYYRERAEAATPQERLAPPAYGLNSRLGCTADGVPYEQTYRIGGLYGGALARISTHLGAALAYAETEAQRAAIMALRDYYKTGDLEAYNRFCVLWVQDTEPVVDFINGFTETYSDPLGMKGSWEGLVHIRSEAASSRTRRLSAEAAWFEAHAPIDARFKKADPKGVTASVVTVAMLAGDSYPATPIGINLPNADWIRAEYGSKSVTIDNIHEAYRLASQANGMDEAFVPDPEVRALLDRYEGITEPLHTDLHECLGHGSGQLLPGVSPDALGAYGSTIEEARADLFALYYMADDKLVEMGLLPDGEAYKACYYRYLLNGLITQFVRIRPGHKIEEAHMRNRALIARYVLARSAADRQIELRGIELIVHDYELVRASIASLLAEVQRIKSEGDYEAARALVEGYAVRVFEEQHAEILERYAKLDIAPYRGFVNPRLELVLQDDELVDVVADYSEGYAEQMLRYSQQYATLPTDPVAHEELRDPHPSSESLAMARELRQGLRRSMDGVVSSSMRDKGLHYGINFGLTQEYIHSRAAELPQSEDLARYLLSRDVRELKLIGQLIYPAEAMTMDKATYLASVSFSNPELRDCLAKSLLDRCPDAPEWALTWLLEGEEYHDIRPVALIVLARWFTRQGRLESEPLRLRLLEIGFELLSVEETDRIAPLQQAALLMLKRWGRYDAEARQAILGREELTLWHSGDHPIYREFAEDLLFELNFEL